MQELVTKDTFKTLVCIQFSSDDKIVINLNTALSALSYFISNDVTYMSDLSLVDELIGKYQTLVKKIGNEHITDLRYNDKDDIAFSIICGLKLKLEKELLTYV